MAQFLSTGPGKQKLIFDGYGYVKTNQKGGSIYWICDNRKLHKCKGSAKTSVNAKDGEAVEVGHEHAHAQNFSKFEIISAMTTMKEKAMNTNFSASSIVTSVTNSFSGVANFADLPKADSLKRTVRRQRFRMLPSASIKSKHFFKSQFLIKSKHFPRKPNNAATKRRL